MIGHSRGLALWSRHPDIQATGLAAFMVVVFALFGQRPAMLTLTMAALLALCLRNGLAEGRSAGRLARLETALVEGTSFGLWMGMLATGAEFEKFWATFAVSGAAFGTIRALFRRIDAEDPIFERTRPPTIWNIVWDVIPLGLGGVLLLSGVATGWVILAMCLGLAAVPLRRRVRPVARLPRLARLVRAGIVVLTALSISLLLHGPVT